jgi:glutamine amidotransferase
VSDKVVIIGSTGANLASLQFALQRLGVDAAVTEDPDRILAAERSILPGVGAAADAMERLRAASLDQLIPRIRRPLLGICLGMQLLFEHSAEDDVRCLGVIPGQVERLPGGADLPVPEMGWNELEELADNALLRGIPTGGYAYFVHSYAAPVCDATIAKAVYGVEFSAAVCHGNYYGTQFHPERSAQLGARILENFLTL